MDEVPGLLNRKDASMKRITIHLVALFLFLCLPNLGFADCTDLGSFNRWVVQDDDSIIFYYGNVPLGIVELQDCTADSSSTINLLESSVCEGDEILVDGERCTILNLTVGE
jgi:hypothetical protein